MDYKAGELAGMKYVVQVAPDDCTGCDLCSVVCPAKDKSQPAPQVARHEARARAPRRASARAGPSSQPLPDTDRRRVHLDVKGVELLEPLFEFSGACAGCGETPYIKLMTQLFGDRALIANATGCTSIYGGNLPTTPYRTNQEGRGPAWSNSLFEDNAEFGLGIRLVARRPHARRARAASRPLAPRLGDELGHGAARRRSRATRPASRPSAIASRSCARGSPDIEGPDARRLELLADYLVRKSVWIVGGDGWAYDIGYGGVDHVLASNADVNLLVLDTEVYSNTGGQAVQGDAHRGGRQVRRRRQGARRRRTSACWR